MSIIFLSMRLFSKLCHSSLHKASVIIDNNIKLLFLTFVCWLVEDYLVAIVNVRKNMYFAKRLSDLSVCRCVWNFFERSCTAKYIFSLIIHIIRISWCTLGSMSLIYFNIRFAWYNLRILKYSLRLLRVFSNFLLKVLHIICLFRITYATSQKLFQYIKIYIWKILFYETELVKLTLYSRSWSAVLHHVHGIFDIFRH